MKGNNQQYTVYTTTEFNVDLTYSSVPQHLNRQTLREEIATIVNGASTQPMDIRNIANQADATDNNHLSQNHSTPEVQWPVRDTNPVSE